MTQRLIGVDVGGTKVSVATIEGATLHEPVVRPTVLTSEDGLVDQLVELVGAQLPAAAVGVGVPSVVDFATGTARSSVNVPLQDLPLRRILGERLGVPVFVDNDATVAALCEAYDDDLRPLAQSLVLFTVGTGVGGGIVLGGRIYRGATGAAAEMGHVLVAADLVAGAPPAAPRPPHPAAIESWAAGRSLDLLARERGLEPGPPLVAAAREGDARAIDALRILGERLGVAIANAINIFDPEQVVVGGGVSAAGDLLLEPARAAAQRFVLPGVGTRTQIRLARWGPSAGVRGAALLAGQEAMTP
ncbi:MAG TPA: ROK family protein [Baekduia sp.]|nr:ROK family protein [Baekduia sp.]